jgi:hypothetical protein
LDADGKVRARKQVHHRIHQRCVALHPGFSASP